MVTHFAPESCPLRKHNFKLMDKYGHHFFRLKFVKPDTGWLFHTYQTKEEYLQSIKVGKDILEKDLRKVSKTSIIKFKYIVL